MDPTNDLSFHPSSPSSESVYFDAVETLPMRFFSKKSSTGVKSEDDQQQAQTADQSPSFATSSSMGTPSRPFRANHYPQPIVDSSPTGDEPGVERTYRESLQSDTTASDLPTHNEVPQRMPQAVAMPEANIDSGHPPASQAPGSSSAHQRNESTSTNAHASDSGYGSPTNQHRRSKSLGSSGRAPIAPVEESAEAKTPGANNEIKPIPILWQESPEGQGNVSRMRSQRTARGEDGGNETLKRSGSVRSTRSGYASDRDRGDQLSIRTTPSMRRRRVDLSSGSFAGGAGTVGPNAEPDLDDTLSERRVAANAELSKKQKLRLSKAEVKEGKQLAAVIKSEAKSEQRALEIAIKELADIQKMQKASIKEEARTHASHASALRAYHKEELEFFSARARRLRTRGKHPVYTAQDATEMLQEKNREVEWLRVQKATHDREREARLSKLSGKS
ncbi:hypothetical protein NLI96_g1153 [Meripilus lineatus]|uniref:DNA binding protein Ncp1 n=1 Tax=Meripilus lineatus TaxID=2056292 RepID=A0AAD5YN40_9APHY|nr:hypothetical protein NLI96_g1153 [Physisporinus lineatus]